MRESVAGSFLLFPDICRDAWEEGPCVCTDAWDEMLMHAGGSLGIMLEPFPPLPLSAWRVAVLLLEAPGPPPCCATSFPGVASTYNRSIIVLSPSL